MNLNEKNRIRIAILDLNEGNENQGMRCLREIIKKWSAENKYVITVKEFDVRVKNEVPSTDFDVYLSSGGPGSPLESEETLWEKNYFNWIREIDNWNNSSNNFPKKYVFFICHSFQLACRYYKTGTVTRRNSTSFGVFPIHLLEAGTEDPVFENMTNPFYAVDSRDYQVTGSDNDRMEELGEKILAIEKDRPHVPFKRAIMAVRFNDYFIGTQFHPEADPVGMTMHLQKEDKKKIVIDNHGEAKWKSMIEHLNDPDKILFTYSHVLPNFLNLAVGNLVEA